MNLPTIVDLATMRKVVKASPFTDWMGVEVTACAAGRAELTLAKRPDMTQHHGYLHGGLVGYLIDNVSSWAAASCSGDVVSSQYSVHLLAPGVGEQFRAVGEVVKAGKRQVVVRAEVFAQSEGVEKLIAVGSAVVTPLGAAPSKT